jgi:cysteine-rich repeat protein
VRLALLAALVGCVEPSLLNCPDSGLLCAKGDVCDTIHHICITPDQQIPCVGVPDETVCAVDGAPGYCRDQICLLPVCGNHYVDHGEACDDGNVVSGDGCNALCTSTELCGNGFLDPGEVCDDGDRISGDGCDSQCRTEAFAWQAIGIVPRYETGTHHAVYDPVRKQIVLVADDMTWTWDGSAWKVLAVGTIGDTSGWSWHQLVWDDDRKSVILVGAAGITADQIWEWNGAQWTRIVSATTPFLASGKAVYDPAVKQVVIISYVGGMVGAQALDISTATWTQIALPPVATLANGYAFGYDAKRNVAVLGAAQATFISMTEWNGATWSPVINGGLPVKLGVTFVWDPNVNQLLSIGGRIDANNVSGQVSGWDGAQWSLRPAVEQLTAPKALPEVVIDPDRNVRVIWGGSTGTIETTSVYELGSEWSGPLGTYPPDFASDKESYTYAYDAGHRRIIAFGGPAEDRNRTDVWGWDGTWHELASCPQGPSSLTPSPIGYDPARDAIVVAGLDGHTYLFHADAWTTLGTTTLFNTVAITYDPVEHGMVAVDIDATWLLPSSDATWQRIADLPADPPGAFASIAFDARTNQIIYTDKSTTSVLDHDHWEHTLSPGQSYAAVANARRGSVELFAPGGNIYERFDGQFMTEDPANAPPAPLASQNPNAMYAPETGALYLIGDLGYSRLILRRTATTVLDACTGGDDDGDGLVDCDDPDCWWSCTPACPPHTSC